MKTFNFIANSASVTQEILNAIAELDEFKGAWRLFGKLTPDRLRNLQKVALSQTITNCVHADGHQVMDTIVARVLRNANADGFDTEIEQFIAGFAFVSQEVAAHYAQIPFSQGSIKQLHRWLSRYQRNKNTIPGQYKSRPNNINALGGDGNISCMLAQTTLPYQTESAMDELVYAISDLLATKQLHPLQTIAHFIGQFLLIHPFDTHNHAMAHILLQLLLLLFHL